MKNIKLMMQIARHLFQLKRLSRALWVMDYEKYESKK